MTGSMAMSYNAQSRMTRDIDVVISIQGNATEKTLRFFQNEYYLSKDAVDAINRFVVNKQGITQWPY